MPAKDAFHNIVRHALEKDGWTITHDPLHIDLIDIEVYIDLGAERLIGAKRENEVIAVEIKSFLGGSTLSEFHLALGQFINYRFVLNRIDPSRQLYLGIPKETYETFFQRKLIQMILQEQKLKIVVYNTTLQEITEWIS